MIGQTASSIPFDARLNVLAAVVRWVEEGVAPETIEGTKFKGTSVQFRRRHCR